MLKWEKANFTMQILISLVWVFRFQKSIFPLRYIHKSTKTEQILFVKQINYTTGEIINAKSSNTKKYRIFMKQQIIIVTKYFEVDDF